MIDECLIGATHKLGAAARAIILLRKKSFDMAICFDGRSNTLLTLWLAGVHQIIYVEGMYSRTKLIKRLVSSKIVARQPDSINRHVVYQYLDIIAQITGITMTPQLAMGHVAADSIYKVDSIMSGFCPGALVVAISASSSTPAKHWDAGKMAQLSKWMVEKHSAQLVFLGSAGEYSYNQAIISAAGVRALNLCGQLSLKDTATLLERCSYIVSMCTGTAHIAAAVGLPAVMIYTCSSFRTWYPFDDYFIPVCSFEACATGFCDSYNCNEHKCVNNISVDDVMLAVEAMQQYLDRRGEASRDGGEFL